MHRQIINISTPPNASSRAQPRADARERARTNPKTTTAHRSMRRTCATVSSNADKLAPPGFTIYECRTKTE